MLWCRLQAKRLAHFPQALLLLHLGLRRSRLLLAAGHDVRGQAARGCGGGSQAPAHSPKHFSGRTCMHAHAGVGPLSEGRGAGGRLIDTQISYQITTLKSKLGAWGWEHESVCGGAC